MSPFYFRYPTKNVLISVSLPTKIEGSHSWNDCPRYHCSFSMPLFCWRDDYRKEVYRVALGQSVCRAIADAEAVLAVGVGRIFGAVNLEALACRVED